VSETDSFVDEVSDELRRDRLFAQFRRFGPYVIAGLVLLVAASAWNEWRKAEAAAAREAAGDALRAALALPLAEDRAKALAAVTGPEGAVPLPARLLSAQALFDAGKEKAAADALSAIAAEAGADPLYRDLAVLRLVSLRGEAMPPAERVTTLDPLTAPGAPFRLLALEQRAIARAALGETAKAIDDLQVVLADPAATEGLKGRAGLLLRALGGSPAATPPAIPAEN
jgi:hypothetical protein